MTWAGKLYSFIISKGLDEMGILVCLEALPVKGEVGDLGHWPPEHTLNQTMTAAKRSATVATIFHSCANSPCKSIYDEFSKISKFSEL